MHLGGHLWRAAVTWDPEGVLSTVPAIATTLFGVATGRLLQAEPDPTARVARLMVRGAALVVVGYAWGWVFPINKKIWTSSYAVFTAGLAAVALAVALFAFDVGPDSPARRRLAQPTAVCSPTPEISPLRPK